MVHWRTLRKFLGRQPALERRHDRQPLIVHTYNLLDTKLFGRTEQIRRLTIWRNSNAQFGVIENHGGFGKSALAYTWFQQQFPPSNLTQYWDGGFWYSFYEPGAGYADFLQRFYVYCSGTSPWEASALTPDDLEDKIEAMIGEYRMLVVLDGFEAMLNAYDVLRSESEAFRDPDEQGTAGAPHDHNERDIASSRFAGLLQDILKKGRSRTKFLFTTRLMPREFENQFGRPKQGMETFELDGLDRDDAREYWQACGLDASDPDLPKFVESIGGHPLALSIMAAVMSTSKMATIAKFREFDPQYDVSENLQPRLPPSKSAGRMRSDVFQAALRRLTKEERILLVRIASYRQPAPLDELENMFVARSRPAADMSFSTRDALIDALNALQNLRLVAYDQTKALYDMHPVVRAVVRSRTSQDEWDDATEKNVEVLEGKPPRRDVRSIKDINDEILIFRGKIELRRYQDAVLRYAKDDGLPGGLLLAFRKLGEEELQADLIGSFFKTNPPGQTPRIEFLWDGDQRLGLSAKSDFAQVLANARQARAKWDEAREFHAIHKSAGRCKDPMCDTRQIAVLEALGCLAQAERVFVQCRAALHKLTATRSRAANSDVAGEGPNLNYSHYRLASHHFDRAIDRRIVWAARLSLLRARKIRAAGRQFEKSYWFANERELNQSSELDIARLARIENDLERALTISRAICRRTTDDAHVSLKGKALLVVAVSYFDIGGTRNYNEAERYLSEYLEIHSRDSHSRRTCRAWRLLVNILIKTNRLDDADQHLTEREERADAWGDLREQANLTALRARLSDARGRREEAVDQRLSVLDKLTNEPDAPENDPLIAGAMTELQKVGALSELRQRVLRLGPPAKDSWMAINPFDRYWTPWFGGTVRSLSD